MTDDDIKAAEKRGYARGYRAGKQKKKRDEAAYRAYREKAAFLDRAYLALLPVAMQVDNWSFRGEAVTTGEQRTSLAVAWAREALRKRPLP